MIKPASRTDFLTEAAKYLPANPVCAELGVLRGEFSVSILNILKPKVLHLIDPWKLSNDKNGKGGYGFLKNTAYASSADYKHVAKQFANEIAKGQIVINRNFSYDAVTSFPNNYFDFIYIDACHLYDAVKADLRDYLPKLKPTGLMCGHDYFTSDIYGVVPAVDEFIDENDFEFLMLSDPAISGGKDCWDWATKRK